MKHLRATLTLLLTLPLILACETTPTPAPATAPPRPASAAASAGTCPNGNPIPKRENCSKLFPAYARAFVGNISVDLEAGGVKLTDLNATLASSIVKLRQDYDQITNMMEIAAKNHCVSTNAAPCDADNQKRLGQIRTVIDTRMADLRAQSIQFNALVGQITDASATAPQKEEAQKDLRTLIADIRKQALESQKAALAALQ